MNNEYTFQDFTNDVADYIDSEYGSGNDLVMATLTDDERYTIKNMLDAHYHFNDSVNNTANYVIDYLRQTRNWTKDNIQ
jgi:hypothetical protein